VGEAWLKHYRQELPAVAFKASTQQQAEGLGGGGGARRATRASSAKAAAGSSGDGPSYAAGATCLGADTLLQVCVCADVGVSVCKCGLRACCVCCSHDHNQRSSTQPTTPNPSHTKQLLKNYARNTAGGKGSITVGVVGLPNVGKSSLINSLKRARVAQVCPACCCAHC
jgi:nuclear GTP-binding protein